MLNKIIRKKIETIGDLKQVLNLYDDDMLINFGTKRLGFRINAYSNDCINLALLSDDLEEYLEVNDYS